MLEEFEANQLIEEREKFMTVAKDEIKEVRTLALCTYISNWNRNLFVICRHGS